MILKLILRILLLIVLITNVSLSQSDSSSAADSLKFYKLNVLSTPENAKVIIDTSYAGVTPLTDYKIKEGKYEIKIVNPNLIAEWQNENQIIKVSIESDTVFNIKFKYFYLFSTNPFDAKVFKGDSLLGYTPLRFFDENKLTGTLIFKKKNYKDYYFDLINYNFETGANITMQSKGKENVNDIVYKNRATQFETQRSFFPIFATGAIAILGGASAINFKNSANQQYERYLINENSLYLDKSNSNDTYFIISVILMQAAIGGLVYFLFFDK